MQHISMEKEQKLFPKDALKKKKRKKERRNPRQFFENRHRHVTSGFMSVLQVLILNKQRC